ncbi:MAG: hypothetical protein V1492_01120 [Candidatus Micrarchaeota archaeon]
MRFLIHSSRQAAPSREERHPLDKHKLPPEVPIREKTRALAYLRSITAGKTDFSMSETLLFITHLKASKLTRQEFNSLQDWVLEGLVRKGCTESAREALVAVAAKLSMKRVAKTLVIDNFAFMPPEQSINVFGPLVKHNPKFFASAMTQAIGDPRVPYDIKVVYLDILTGNIDQGRLTQKEIGIKRLNQSAVTLLAGARTIIASSSVSVVHFQNEHACNGLLSHAAPGSDSDMVMARREFDNLIADEIAGAITVIKRLLSNFHLAEGTKEKIIDFFAFVSDITYSLSMVKMLIQLDTTRTHAILDNIYEHINRKSVKDTDDVEALKLIFRSLTKKEVTSGLPSLN